MKKLLFTLATLGWLASLTTNLYSLNGVDLSDEISFIWGLHVGIFVVWIPTVIEIKKWEKSKLESNRISLKDFWQLIDHTPLLVKALAILGWSYAMINFFTAWGGGSIRMFSGHWIAFYGIAAAVLYPKAERTI